MEEHTVKLVAFRIMNFRSILDTSWCDLSTDNITGLIGQNESGKSSILEALYSFYNGELEGDYLRSDGKYPQISCSFEIEQNELQTITADYLLPDGLLDEMKSSRNRINLTRDWIGATNKDSTLSLEQEPLKALWNTPDEASTENGTATTDATTTTAADAAPRETEPSQEAVPVPEETLPMISQDELIEIIMDEMPVFELFEDNGSLLPPEIDLDDVVKKNTKVKGIKGALNFLTISGISTDDLTGSNNRVVGSKIREANKNLTKDFQKFWSQYIGKNNKIEIELELKNHDASVPAKAGLPYLTFWVKDGGELLHPAQRSKGVQWFLSFFLQLKASALASDNGHILLIDEPGANLHAKAQEDVLKVFEDIKKNLQVVYTTHSPYLIEAGTLYRLLAVQRSKEDDSNSETQVFGMHKLEAASEETLLPVYTLIGVGMQHQRVIKAKNNIILEEPSAFYYMKAFRKLAGETSEMNFLPATGVTKIPLLVNLFLGWSLDFVVLTDDDDAGKKTRRKIKSDIYGGDDEEAKKHLLGIGGCNGVEDVFTKGDFRKYVLGDEGITYAEENSKYMDEKGESKVFSALKFSQKVEEGTVTMDMLANTTQSKIRSTLKQIKDCL